MSILELINRNFGKKFNLGNYQKLRFFEKQPDGNWQKFLVRRIREFKLLHLLSTRLDSEFFAGYDLTFAFEEDSNPDIVAGACILNVKLTGRQIFDFILGKLGIAQVDVVPGFDPYNGPFIGEQGVIGVPLNYYPVLKAGFFVSEDLIISDEFFYAKKPEKWNDNLFLDFFEKHEHSAFIPHEMYIDWLLKWFPGLIRIRSLVYSSA